MARLARSRTRTGRRRRTAAAALVGCAAVASTSAALAQTALDDSVLGRARPDFDPLGLELDAVLYRMGLLDKKTVDEKRSPLASFVVRPVTELDTRFDSNVFRTEQDTKSDEIASLRPSLAIDSNWKNHQLGIFAGADIGRHLHYQSEDFENYRVGGRGRVDVTEDFALDGETRFERTQEPRGTSEQPAPVAGVTVQPVRFTMLGFAGGARYFGEPVLLHLKGRRQEFSYFGGDPLTTPTRDRAENTVSLRAGYELIPGTTAFVEPSYNIRDYDQRFDASGFLQGSHGYEILAGGTWDVSGVTFAELAVGWLRQSFKEPSFEPVSGPSISGKLVWNPTKLLTVTGNLGRRVSETVTPGVSGILVTDGSLGLDFEYLENLIISGKLNYSDQVFKGDVRRDHVIGGTVAFDYRIGHKWYARLGFDETHRDSNVISQSYTDQMVYLQLGEHL